MPYKIPVIYKLCYHCTSSGSSHSKRDVFHSDKQYYNKDLSCGRSCWLVYIINLLFYFCFLLHLDLFISFFPILRLILMFSSSFFFLLVCIFFYIDVKRCFCNIFPVKCQHYTHTSTRIPSRI